MALEGVQHGAAINQHAGIPGCLGARAIGVLQCGGGVAELEVSPEDPELRHHADRGGRVDMAVGLDRFVEHAEFGHDVAEFDEGLRHGRAAFGEATIELHSAVEVAGVAGGAGEAEVHGIPAGCRWCIVRVCCRCVDPG